MKKLYINPITRTIAPKYRGQKAVYIAKKDHNSVLLGFEIPKIVDGHDISVDGNIIHIHYANISKDETSVSRGMSEAVNITVDDEEGIVTFCWRIPNTATRYAGVVSIGVTIERYEDVDGIPQEVYSWSTAPYGGTIVQESMDNSDEVCEGDFDYLVETCNAIVDLALKDNIAQVEQHKADVEAMRDKAKEYRDEAEEYKDNALQSADEAYAYLYGANDVVQESEETNVVRLHSLTEEASEKAKKYADDAYIYTYGDESRPTNNAKYFYEQTKNYAQGSCNAIVGTATGNNAVRIDDVSPTATIMDVSLESANLIDMSSAMTIGYRLPVEVGKTYTISAKVNDNISFTGKYWGVRWKVTHEGAEEDRDNMLFHDGTSSKEASYSFTVGQNDSRDYYIDMNGFAREDFEYIQLNEGATALPYTPYIEDISNIKVMYFGKNLAPDDIFDESKLDAKKRYILPYTLPAGITLQASCEWVNGKVEAGYLYFDYSLDGGNTWIQPWGGAEDWRILIVDRIRTATITTKPNAVYGFYCNLFDKAFPRIKNIQLELGEKTEYEPYKEPVDDAVAVYPTTTLVSDTSGVKITAEYKKDINKVIARLEQAIANL